MSLNLDYDALTLTQATALQTELRSKIDLSPLQGPILTVAGADISLNRFSETIFAGIVILRYYDLQPVGFSMVESRTSFPYVPGFLAFREVPALVTALEQIPSAPDVLFVDGQGIAHPRRMGIAAHLGALTGKTTMGCAKKPLFGRWNEPGNSKGDFSEIKHKEETIGFALRTKSGTKPVFISPGNGMSLSDSLRIAQRCSGSYRIPEPTRRAHEFVNLFRTGKLPGGYHEIASQQLF